MGLKHDEGRRKRRDAGIASGVDVGSEPLASLGGKAIRRSEFFSGAGKLAAVVGLGGGVGSALAGAATASAITPSQPPNSKAGPGASKRAEKIGLIEVSFSPFFTEIFQVPMAAYLKANKSPWQLTFGNENSSLPTGIQLYNEYVADNYGLLILSTGDEMTTWQSTVEKSTKEGVVFINHSTQAVSGATQNTLFSHKQGGIEIGGAAVAWAKKNNIKQPIVGLLGNLSDPQGSKRTTWAWKTIKAHFPNAQLAASVQAYNTAAVGATGAANLLAAHPDVNIMVCFDTISGVGALTSCTHAGKTNRDTFFLGMVDSEDATLKLIADANSIVQANFGTFFAYSGILMIKDGITAHSGKPIYPTRLLYGIAITTPEQAKTFDTIAFDPLNPKYAYVYSKYFKYLDTPVATGQVPPGSSRDAASDARIPPPDVPASVGERRREMSAESHWKPARSETSGQAPVVLRCEGIVKWFGGVQSLAGVSLSVHAGEVVALVGDNGAGKSTLVKTLSGIHQPDAGEIWLGEEKMEHLTASRARLLGVETVHQDLMLCDNLDAVANVVLGQEPVRFKLGPVAIMNKRAATRIAHQRLDEVGIRIADFDVSVRRLSGGQRQAVAIARAMMKADKVMMLDEPTAALGVHQTHQTLEVIRSVASRGIGVIVISHSIDDVFAVADRIVVLRLGRIVFDTPAAETTPDLVIGHITGGLMGSRR